MEWPEIRLRIAGGEDSRTEFKRGLGDPVFPGQGDLRVHQHHRRRGRPGRLRHSRWSLESRRTPTRRRSCLASFLLTGCSAPVHARIGRREDLYGWVFWVEVPRQRGFEPMRYDGRVWVRRDRSSVEPSATELQELYNAFGYVLTEERAILDAPPAHIDLAAFRTYLERLGFDTTDDPQPDSVGRSAQPRRHRRNRRGACAHRSMG